MNQGRLGCHSKFKSLTVPIFVHISSVHSYLECSMIYFHLSWEMWLWYDVAWSMNLTFKNIPYWWTNYNRHFYHVRCAIYTLPPPFYKSLISSDYIVPKIITDFLTRHWTLSVWSSECLTSNRDWESCKCTSFPPQKKWSMRAELFPSGARRVSCHWPKQLCPSSVRACRKRSQMKYLCLFYRVR